MDLPQDLAEQDTKDQIGNPDLPSDYDGPVVWVDLFCGCFVGAPKWHSLDVYEPAECGGNARIRVPADEFSEQIASAHCPDCGQDLCQSDGHMTQVSGPDAPSTIFY